MSILRADYENQARQNIAINQATKSDQNKAPIDLIDSEFILGIADVLAFGAKKYAAYNWRKGIALSRLYAAAQRHLLAYNNNEDNDSESSLDHIYHAACCLMFIAWTKKHKPELDDRWRKSNE